MSVKRHTVYNIAGAVSPLVVTLITVPLYLSAIGEGRYGLLALVWLLLGYFGLFDLGLSTATANALARSRRTDPSARSRIFVTSLLTNLALGSIVGLAVSIAAPFVLDNAHQLSPDLKREVAAVIPWLSASIPLVTVGGVFNGVLSSHERFGAINIINVIGTVLFQVAPLWATSVIGIDLPSIIPVAVLARAVPVLITGFVAAGLISPLGGRYDLSTLRTLLAYGGWVMLTNLIGPILVSIDQFAIASFLGAAAVAHYSIAYSLAIRFQVIPQALTQSLFPRLSREVPQDAIALASQAFRSVLVVMTILIVPAVLVIKPFMALWIGPQFASVSGFVAQVLLVSVWINALAFVPFAFLQAQGRPGLVARFHLAEIIPFLIVLYLAIHMFGLLGAAFAWAARVLLDTILLIKACGFPRNTFGIVPLGTAAVAAAWSCAWMWTPSSVEAVVAAALAGAALVLWGLSSDPILHRTAMRLVRR